MIADDAATFIRHSAKRRPGAHRYLMLFLRSIDSLICAERLSAEFRGASPTASERVPAALTADGDAMPRFAASYSFSRYDYHAISAKFMMPLATPLY